MRTSSTGSSPTRRVTRCRRGTRRSPSCLRAGMTDPVRTIADAVLYEGYILWPYRRSAPKNRSRWTFGAVFPPAWSAEHPDDACLLQGQYLVEGSHPQVTVTLRFLQVVERRLRDRSGAWVAELDGQ